GAHAAGRGAAWAGRRGGTRRRRRRRRAWCGRSGGRRGGSSGHLPLAGIRGQAGNLTAQLLAYRLGEPVEDGQPPLHGLLRGAFSSRTAPHVNTQCPAMEIVGEHAGDSPTLGAARRVFIAIHALERLLTTSDAGDAALGEQFL